MTPEEMLREAESCKQINQWARADALTTAAILRQGQLDIEAKLDKVLGLLEGVEEPSEPAIPDPKLGCLICGRKDVFTMYCETDDVGTLVPHCERCHKSHDPDYTMIASEPDDIHGDRVVPRPNPHSEACTTRATMDPAKCDCGNA